MSTTGSPTTKLARIIADDISAHGPMSVETFMNACLAHPEHGYYLTRDPLGTKGDFTTAPEISQMFGELLGLWAADMWIKLGSPGKFVLAELGPGRGTLMADAVRATARVAGFAKAAHIALVETSPVLKSAQQKNVPLATHYTNVNDLPDGPLIILANEFFDALPIRQYVKQNGQWFERAVTVASNEATPHLQFQFTTLPLPVETRHLPPAVQHASEGEIAETCPIATDIARTIATRFEQAPGAALFVDYGHAHSATGDTLQALHQHKYADVLEHPGEADLTAHVDFEALAHAMPQARTYAPITQAVFLKSLGIEVRADFLKANADKAQAHEIDAALTRLINPDQMGQLFKVMAATSIGATAPAGF